LEGTVVAAGVIVGIVAIMAMVVHWGPRHDCALQFPKIVGCALGTYEGLSGGLIAAGGAIFAGWLAWSAARAQIALERTKAFRAELAAFESRLNAAHLELARLQKAQNVMQSIQTNLSDRAPRAHLYY
jgi:hypothetical protein